MKKIFRARMMKIIWKIFVAWIPHNGPRTFAGLSRDPPGSFYERLVIHFYYLVLIILNTKINTNIDYWFHAIVVLLLQIVFPGRGAALRINSAETWFRLTACDKLRSKTLRFGFIFAISPVWVFFFFGYNYVCCFFFIVNRKFFIAEHKLID